MQNKTLGQQLASTTKVWRHVLDARLQPLGLSQAKWLCLLELIRADEELTQSELAQRLGIEPATLVRLLDRLEAHGWVVRQADIHDRRSKRIRLTERSRAIAIKVQQTADDLRVELVRGIPAEDMAICSQVLSMIDQRARILLSPGTDLLADEGEQ